MATIYPIENSSSEDSVSRYLSEENVSRFLNETNVLRPSSGLSRYLSEVSLSRLRPSSETSSTLKDLAPDLFFHIYRYLDRKDIHAFLSTNKEIYQNESNRQRLTQVFWGHRCINRLPSVSSEYYMRLCMANGKHAIGFKKREYTLQKPCMRPETSESRTITNTQFASNGGKLFFRREDNSYSIHDFDTDESIDYPKTDPIKYYDLSSDGTKAIYVFENSKELILINRKTGLKRIYPIPIQEETLPNFGTAPNVGPALSDGTVPSDRTAPSIDHLQISRDGSRALVQYADTIRFLNLKTKKFWDYKLDGSSTSILKEDCLPCLHPNGTVALLGCKRTGKILYVDSEKEAIRELHLDEVSSIRLLQINSDGTKALFTSGDRLIGLWDLKTGECKLYGLNENIIQIKITPDGSKAHVVTRSANGTYKFRLLDFSSRIIRAQDTGLELTNRVHGLTINDDGATATSFSQDHFVTQWDFSLLPFERVCRAIDYCIKNRNVNVNAAPYFLNLIPDAIIDGNVMPSRNHTNIPGHVMGYNLCEYIKKYFLYNIAELFQKAECFKNNENAEQSFKTEFEAALKRFQDLPKIITNHPAFQLAFDFLRNVPNLKKENFCYIKALFLSQLPESITNNQDFENALSYFEKLPDRIQKNEFYQLGLKFYNMLPDTIKLEIFSAFFKLRKLKKLPFHGFNHYNPLNLGQKATYREMFEAIETVILRQKSPKETPLYWGSIF